MKSHAKLYDRADAVTYLHEIVVAARGAPVPRNTLAHWAKEFKVTAPDDALIRLLANDYITRYRSAGLA
jgi:hypothetical protein